MPTTSPESIRRGARPSRSASARRRLRRSLTVCVASAAALVIAPSAQAVTDLHGGVFVIGDSISTGGNSGAAVPYAQQARDRLVNGESTVRAIGGSTAEDHYSGKYKTVFEALGSNAKTYIVELGTNDASCLHIPRNADGTTNKKSSLYSSACDDLLTGTARPPRDGTPAAKEFQEAKMRKAVTTMSDLAKALLSTPGSCLIWAGPREVDVYGTAKSEWAFYNSAVRSLAAGQNGRMVVYDFNEFANGAASSWGDFTTRSPFTNTDVPDVHQHLPFTSGVLGYNLIGSVISGCHRAAKA